MRKLGTGYAKYFNKKHDRVGVLFQSRFKNILVDDERYVQYLLVYINVLNPLGIVEPKWKEGILRNKRTAKNYLKEYRFSSYPDFIGEVREENKILDNILFPRYFDIVFAFVGDSTMTSVFAIYF